MKKTKWMVFTLILALAAAMFMVTRASADTLRRSTAQAETTGAGETKEAAKETELFEEPMTEAEAPAEMTSPEEETTPAATEAPTTEEITTETEPETTEAEVWPVAFQQSDPRWCDIPYGYGNWAGTNPAYLGKGGKNGFGGGCGIFATINAAYYLNRSFIEPAELAEYAVKNGFHISGKGTDEGLVRSFIKARGEQYGLSYIKTARRLSSIRDELMSGAVAVAHLNGHYIAVVDYNDETGQYLVLDSAAVEERGTLPDGIRWMTEKEFTGKMELSQSDGALQVFGTRD